MHDHNDNWGYAKDDDNWKSPAKLIGLLVETASKGRQPPPQHRPHGRWARPPAKR
ncbi:MAG: hypothetical protein IPF47_02385 [Gemmatimonadetes bacterium]|nr:hypothetical protein [Gemmatimonadota bacterium]